MSTKPLHRSLSPVGRLLQHWRSVRRKSQLALAMDAGISARHLSFVETGRSSPSRDMVITLARTLDVPLRERNALLVAAGYAPQYSEAPLAAPALAPVRRALDFILRQQEPFPAVVMDRHWNLVGSNEAATQFFARFIDLGAQASPPNILRLLFHPERLRPFILNWETLAEALIQRVHREAVGGVPDEATVALLAEILSYPGVPPRWHSLQPAPALSPVIPVEFRKGSYERRFFSTVTTLGTPQDVTVQEIRIECFFPADDLTDRLMRSEAQASPGQGSA